MKHMIQAQATIAGFQKMMQQRGVAQGKAFRRFCSRKTNAAAYRDLDEIHAEIAAKRGEDTSEIEPHLEAA